MINSVLIKKNQVGIAPIHSLIYIIITINVKKYIF